MESARYSDASYMENSAHGRDGRTPYSAYGDKGRIFYVERRKRKRKCCCCFPLVPGVYILLIMYFISALFTLLIGGLGIKTGELLAFFSIIIVYGSIAVLVIPVALFGLFRWNPKLFVASPGFFVFALICHLGSAIFAFAMPKHVTGPSDAFSLEQQEGNRLPAALALSAASGFVFNFLLGLYYTYVMIRMYKVMKKEPKNR